MTTAILIPQRLLEPGCPHDGMVLIIQRESKPNPLTEAGFLEYEANLYFALEEATEGPAERLKKAFAEAIENMSLGPIGRWKLKRKINRALKDFADELLELTPGIAADHMIDIAEETVFESRLTTGFVQRSIQKSEAEPLFERHFLMNSNAMFQGAYLRDTLSKTAQNIVVKAHQDFADLPHDKRIKATAQALKEGLGRTPQKVRQYWKTFSANALNNARTYALLNEYDSTDGVIAYRVHSVKDSKTTNICRALNGKVFPIKKALNKFKQFFGAKSLEEVSSISPMVFGDQKTGYHYMQGDKKVSVDPDNHSKLVSSGVSFPPFHFNCRSTVRPVYGAIPAGAKLRESSKDFEDKALEYEYGFHRDRLNELSREYQPLEKIKDRAERKLVLDKLSEKFYNYANEFNSAWNHDEWLKTYKSNYEKTIEGGDLSSSIRDLRARVLELQGAHYAQAKKHQVLGFEIFVGIKKEKNGRKYLRTTDVDILTFNGSALGNWQIKFGKNLNSPAVSNMKEQVAAHMEYMADPKIFEYNESRQKNPHISGKVYEKINSYFGGKPPEKRIVFGAASPMATGRKPLENVKIIQEQVTNNVSAVLIKNIDDLNSEIYQYGGLR